MFPIYKDLKNPNIVVEPQTLPTKELILDIQVCVSSKKVIFALLCHP